MSDRVWEEPSRTLRSGVSYRTLVERLREESARLREPGAPAALAPAGPPALPGGPAAVAPGGPDPALEVVRLPLAAAAWVAELLGEDLGRPVLAIVPGETDALAWLEAAELFGDARRGAAVYVPGRSLSPYHEAETSLLVRAQEAVALDAVVGARARAVVATPRALFRLLPLAGAFARAVLPIHAGEEHPIEELALHLVRWGYRRADLVFEVGDFAVRGGVFDLFPPGEELPLRLDLFGDTVEAIRSFDPGSQRSQDAREGVRVLPLSPFPAAREDADHLADLLAERCGGRPAGEAAERLAELRAQGSFPGWEAYLPLAQRAHATLPDLLADSLLIAVDPATLRREVEHHAELLAGEYQARLAHGRFALPPEELEQPAERVLDLLAGAQVRISDLVTGPAGPTAGPAGPTAVAAGAGRGRPRPEPIDFHGGLTDVFSSQLPRFPREVETARARGERCLLVANPAHRERLAELLEGREVPVGRGGVEIVPGELGRGFRLPPAGVALYGEQQLLPRRAPMARPARARFGPFVGSLRDLKVGDFVVHVDHGIAQFTALTTVGGDGSARERLPPALRALVPAESPVEVMELVYAGGKRLLVPLDRLDLIQKYSGIEGVAPRLDQLGGTSWNRTKARLRGSLRDMAGELLRLYAERQLARAPAMGPDSDRERQVEAAFAYEETADQLDAIAVVKADLERDRPMDRLLCGDVGYGKTEVAMRAAFKVVDNGYQVAVLAPTTILADQHLLTFRRRFEGFPVAIEMISRFRTPAEIREVKKRLALGKVDVLIGTHRLLSKDIDIPLLGLLIVDEEQRFGVAQKERLKQLKKDVHVLAMSATPVPRTLQLSLAGVRDMSVIETPPKDRMAVETAVLPYSPDLVREAIEFELERSGQVYYVYNRVESIEGMLAQLREMVPGVRITVGHGQLDERELARRMHAFTAQEYDVLLATTIIENGIDIPNVNTMIVHRADRFGLAQLYQLRGRVGRSNQLAYCYLLVERDRVLTETAGKRLAAIREFTDLGAGFRIAARDLEIRGAGNLLGAEQSGHIAAVGIETYLKMLDEAVRELKGEKLPEEGPSTSIDLPLPISIPRTYVEDANLRLELYRRIAAGEADREELLAELADRFGPPPPAVRTLLEVAALKRQAEALRVQSIGGKSGELVIRLRRDARVDVERLIALVGSRPGASFSPTGVLTLPAPAGEEALGMAQEVLAELAAPEAAEVVN